MSLGAGSKLGPYEILSPIGAGGMGEVYRARDTKLKRDVAVKVLPDVFASDPERMARFQREAEVLASLNHPNIAHLYGIEERALVMELVEGETLPCPLPVHSALNYAKQIAEALEYAHERGVVHRDLKPANIKITPEGVVKVLDFGLAKAIDDPLPGADPSNSPTLTLGATRVGMILGTAAYMSPEQAVGKPADRRSDIFSFGVVLYEMLSGKGAFVGESAGDILASVVKDDPDWSKLPAATPHSVRTLLRRCLTKDRKQRLQAIGEARIALENPAVEDTAPPSTASPSSPRWWALVAGVLSAALAMLAFVHFREQPPPPTEPVSFQLYPPEKTNFNSNLIAVSPDGRKLAFSATDAEGRGQLWVRTLDSIEARMLSGTENATDPFWAPDSRFLAFQSGGKLRKIDVTGGPPQTLCDIAGTGFIAGDWNRDGVILFGSPTAGILKVSAAGGPASVVTALEGSEIYHRKPSFLPDGRHFLYLRASSDLGSTGVYLGSLDSKPEQQKSKLLVLTPAFPAYAGGPDPNMGRLLFLREGALMAQTFDTRRLESTGEPVPVVERVATYGNVGAIFSASANGVLAYRGGGPFGNSRLTWYDRQGRKLGSSAEAPANNGELALSPDAASVAVGRVAVGNRDIWLAEFARGANTRLTSDPGQDGFPVWSPDGRTVVFTSNRNGPADLFQKSAAGSGEDEVLLKSSEQKYPQDWSRDGRFLLYTTQNGQIGGATAPGAKAGSDLWVLPMKGPEGAQGSDARKPVLFLAKSANATQAKFSPDGHWIVYNSNESGRPEVYVRPFPPSSNGGGQSVVSTGGGYQPLWRRDGKEILYLAPDNRVMSVDVSVAPAFKPGIAKPLFVVPITGGANITTAGHYWDVSSDGQRFLINATLEDAGSPPITVVMNWTTGMKK